MSISDTKILPNPPRLFQSLIAGFDAITNHFGLALFPIFLDLFLWLGPRLRIYRLMKGFFESMTTLPGMDDPDLSNLMKINRDLWLLVSEKLNLFSILRTYPVGVPSLMVSIQPGVTPVGARLDFEVSSISSLGIGFVTLMLVGLLFGTIYFWAVAQVTLSGKTVGADAFRQCIWAAYQVILLSLFWFTLLVVISIPVSCLISAFAFGGAAGGNIGLFIGGGVLVWLLFPLVFSPHGIFIDHKEAWSSILNSLRLVRYTFPGTTLLFLIVVVLSEGLDVLWRVPKDASWLTLVGLAGHGFISTGLLAATFIYYRDATQWVEEVLKQVKHNAFLQ